MSTIFIAVVAFLAYLIAYHTYGRWISRKIFGLDPLAKVPSQELRDDIESLGRILVPAPTGEQIPLIELAVTGEDNPLIHDDFSIFH